jgi:hypothetical protein
MPMATESKTVGWLPSAQGYTGPGIEPLQRLRIRQIDLAHGCVAPGVQARGGVRESVAIPIQAGRYDVGTIDTGRVHRLPQRLVAERLGAVRPRTRRPRAQGRVCGPDVDLRIGVQHQKTTGSRFVDIGIADDVRRRLRL